MTNSAEEINTRIYNELCELFRVGKANNLLRPGLFKNGWGALFYIIYYEQFGETTLNNAVSILTQLYENLTLDESVDYSYCSGYSGSFWLLNHLNKHEFIDVNIREITSGFIEAVIIESNLHLNNNDFDFLHGSSGICNLLVEFADRSDVQEHLQFFVNKLSELGKKTNQGLSLPMFYYHTNPPVKSKLGIDAFSLAHGSCALQIILSKIHKAGILPEKCESIIYESMEFILNHENNPGAVSLFPGHLKNIGMSRLSWCYGDLGVAASLWHCGVYFKEKKWMDKAVDILYFNSKRNKENSGIVDTCLCHGTAGNAAIYRRFWHETNEKSFLTCAEYWSKQTLDMIDFSKSPNRPGIKGWGGKEMQWQYNWDLLDGSAGVGLSLLSCSHKNALPWDEFLLLS